MCYFKLNRYLTLLITLIIVASNVILDHFYAPKGIDYTPIIIVIVTCLITLNTSRFNILMSTISIYFFIAINDIGIKLYGGGMHDLEGQSWVGLFLMIGVMLAIPIMVFSSVKDNSVPSSRKIIAIFLFLSLIVLHLYIFDKLGIGRYYPINN